MSRLLVTTMLLLLLACSKKTATPDACAGLGAVWVGDPAEPRLELRIGAETIPFKPSGEIYPPNTSVEVFSPDCAWALLPQDNYGPYHLVKVSELRAYLNGSAKPFASVQKDGSVHTDAVWRSAREVEFFASCCGGVEVFRVTTSAPDKLSRVFFAAEAPRGVSRSADGGYSAK